MRYDLAVFIGRFQPFHDEHLRTVEVASKMAKEVLILVGGEGRAPSIRDPFSANTRKTMIRNACSRLDISLGVRSIRDHMYNDTKWATGVREAVKSYSGAKNIVIVGSHKDETSFYLDMFPEWDFHEVGVNREVSATDIREVLFEDSLWKNSDLEPNLPVPNIIYNHLKLFRQNEEYKHLKDEYDFIKGYKKAWEAAPYKPYFITTDVVVECLGHILVVERGGNPGKGQLALPGGFLDHSEKLIDCAIRELKEETRIKVPVPVLRGSIINSKVFDHPNRSLRGRTVTHAFHILLKDNTLPKVKGSDDAAKAFWIPGDELMSRSSEVYEDHYFIVEELLNL